MGATKHILTGQLNSNLATKQTNLMYSIDTLTSINQITAIGIWKIGSISDNIASSMGIKYNVGDYTMVILHWQWGDGKFQFGSGFLLSPRWNTEAYLIRVWENSLTAREL